jgi:heterodisulfide reductase subunit B
LDAYQGAVNSTFKTNFAIPILYFTQLVGAALGLTGKEILLGKELVSADRLLSSYAGGRL